MSAAEAVLAASAPAAVQSPPKEESETAVVVPPPPDEAVGIGDKKPHDSDSFEEDMLRERRVLLSKLEDKKSRFWRWMLATSALNALAAAATLLVWSHLGYGAASFHWTVEQSSAGAGSALWYGGFALLFCLYLLDFFTAPIVPRASRPRLSAVSAEEGARAGVGAGVGGERQSISAPGAGETIISAVDLEVGSSPAKVPKEANREGEHAAADKDVPAVNTKSPSSPIAAPRIEVVPPPSPPKDHGANNNNSPSKKVSEVSTTPATPKIGETGSKSRQFGFVYGTKTGVSEIGTHVCRGLFALAGVMALCWGITATNRYPHYPVMIMISILILAQILLRYSARPEQHHKLVREVGGKTAFEDTDCEVLRHIKDRIPDEQQRAHVLMEILTRHLLVSHDKLLYYKAFAISTLVTAMVVFNVWLYWAFIGSSSSNTNYWSNGVRDEMRADGIRQDNTLGITEEAAFNMQFNVWAAPLLFCVGLVLVFFLLALRCYLHVRYTKTDDLLTEIARTIASQDCDLGDNILGVGSMDGLVETVKICVCAMFAAALCFC